MSGRHLVYNVIPVKEKRIRVPFKYRSQTPLTKENINIIAHLINSINKERGRTHSGGSFKHKLLRIQENNANKLNQANIISENQIRAIEIRENEKQESQPKSGNLNRAKKIRQNIKTPTKEILTRFLGKPKKILDPLKDKIVFILNNSKNKNFYTNLIKLLPKLNLKTPGSNNRRTYG
jgi:hypothetical protein